MNIRIQLPLFGGDESVISGAIYSGTKGKLWEYNKRSGLTITELSGVPILGSTKSHFVMKKTILKRLYVEGLS